MMFEENVLFAFMLTAIAGLSTGIGSAIAFFTDKTNRSFLSVTLGFSAGVMIYVSFVELFAVAKDQLVGVYGPQGGNWMVAAGFFFGMAVITLIDRFVPSYENPHEVHSMEKIAQQVTKTKLMRTGVMTALAIGIHNFPEGLATFAAALSNPALGITITIAIALHNIPEGISVSVPIYYATGSRKKAFWLSFLSGVSEPLGALIGYLLLRPYFSETVFGILFAATAGIMVFISLDELIPTAKEYGKGHLAIYGVIAGMAVMALSLVMMM